MTNEKPTEYLIFNMKRRRYDGGLTGYATTNIRAEHCIKQDREPEKIVIEKVYYDELSARIKEALNFCEMRGEQEWTGAIKAILNGVKV
jgi:hypothetical protein